MKKRIVKTLLGAALAASMIASTCTGVLAESEENVTLTWAVFETDNYTAEVWQHIIDALSGQPRDQDRKGSDDRRFQTAVLKDYAVGRKYAGYQYRPCRSGQHRRGICGSTGRTSGKFEDSAVVSFNGVKNLVPAYKAYRTQVFYNKHQFEDAGITEVPTTWDEFIQVCDTLQEAGYTPLMGVGAADIWATAFGYWTGVVNSELYTAYPNFNEDILSGELPGKTMCSSIPLKSWQTLTPYYHKGSMSFSNTQATSEFLSGSAAMFMDGAWSTTTLITVTNNSADDFGTFMMPTPSGAKTYCTMPAVLGCIRNL